MGVYTETLLTIKSQDTDFMGRLFVAISHKPKPTVIQNITNRLFRREHDCTLGLMEYLLPMPEQLEKTVTNGYSGESPEWREWRIDNWGAPYDVALAYCERIGDSEIRMRFTSYNGILTTGLENASKIHGFDFSMLYHCDHGGVGLCTQSDHAEYDFPGEVAPAAAGIPKELIETFDLNELYVVHTEDD